MRSVFTTLTAAVLASSLLICSLSAAERWAFTPGEDPLSDEAVLDLRFLNEQEAGTNGWIQLSEDGNGFVRGDGETIRFWAITSNRYFTKRMASLEDMRKHAKAMAKRGVNMVRFHMTVPEKKAPIDQVDEELLGQFFKLFTALKEEGIYSTVSPYWAHNATKVSQRWADDIDGENLNAVLFYHERLQAAYKNWVRIWLTTPNPHTGVPIAQDPAFAIFQNQNEDSLLWWGMQKYSDAQRAILESQYADWLQKRHGSLDAALAAWDGAAEKGDDVAGGVLKLMHIWSLTQDLGAAQAKRAADQTRFFAELQRQWHDEVARFIHEDLDCPVLVNAGNWRSADPARLMGAMRWSYDANAVMAKNQYFGAPHAGPKSGYRVLKGHHFKPQSGIREPHLLPMARRQVAGKPFLITETLWSPPNTYQAEGCLLAAAYQALGGVDAHYWFCASSGATEWVPPANGKWFIGNPTTLGQFPAAALLFRRGDLQPGEVAVHERRSLDEVFNREPALLLEGAGFDPNRDQTDVTAASLKGSAISPLAYLVGPVVESFSEQGGEDDIIDLEQYIDQDAGRVTSSTGQLMCDYDDGLFTMQSPRSQAAAGWLADAGVLDLGDVQITCDNEFAVIIATSLDGLPLTDAKRVLIQMGTDAVPTGWAVEEASYKDKKQSFDGYRITNYGTAPWAVGNLSAKLTIANTSLSEAVVLDPNGYAQRTIPLQTDAKGVSLELPADALYVVLR